MTTPRKVTPVAARSLLTARRATLGRSQRSNADEGQALRLEKDSQEKAANEEIAGVLVSLSDREQSELVEIDAALGRIAAGTFGRCEQCARPIAPRRLAALPEARTCVACASGA